MCSIYEKVRLLCINAIYQVSFALNEFGHFAKVYPLYSKQVIKLQMVYKLQIKDSCMYIITPY